MPSHTHSSNEEVLVERDFFDRVSRLAEDSLRRITHAFGRRMEGKAKWVYLCSKWLTRLRTEKPLSEAPKVMRRVAQGATAYAKAEIIASRGILMVHKLYLINAHILHCRINLKM